MIDSFSKLKRVFAWVAATNASELTIELFRV